MRATCLRKAPVRLHLHGVYQVRELHSILNEEHGDIVTHQVPVALGRVELDGKAAHVARCIYRTRPTGYGGKAREHRDLHTDVGQHLGGGVFFERVRQLKKAMGCRSSCMHDALGDAFMVKVRDLLAQDEVFQQRGAARRSA